MAGRAARAPARRPGVEQAQRGAAPAGVVVAANAREHDHVARLAGGRTALGAPAQVEHQRPGVQRGAQRGDGPRAVGPQREAVRGGEAAVVVVIEVAALRMAVAVHAAAQGAVGAHQLRRRARDHGLHGGAREHRGGRGPAQRGRGLRDQRHGVQQRRVGFVVEGHVAGAGAGFAVFAQPVRGLQAQHGRPGDGAVVAVGDEGGAGLQLAVQGLLQATDIGPAPALFQRAHRWESPLTQGRTDEGMRAGAL
ncbi:hypothetical protein D9M68_709960 [compost metagenome]